MNNQPSSSNWEKKSVSILWQLPDFCKSKKHLGDRMVQDMSVCHTAIEEFRNWKIQEETIKSLFDNKKIVWEIRKRIFTLKSWVLNLSGFRSEIEFWWNAIAPSWLAWTLIAWALKILMISTIKTWSLAEVVFQREAFMVNFALMIFWSILGIWTVLLIIDKLLLSTVNKEDISRVNDKYQNKENQWELLGLLHDLYWFCGSESSKLRSKINFTQDTVLKEVRDRINYLSHRI